MEGVPKNLLSEIRAAGGGKPLGMKGLTPQIINPRGGSRWQDGAVPILDNAPLRTRTSALLRAGEAGSTRRAQAAFRGKAWEPRGSSSWLGKLENMSGARMLRYGGAIGAGVGAINRAGRALDSARNGRMGGALANGAFAAGLAYTAYDLGIARGAMAQHLGKVATGWAKIGRASCRERV